MKTKFFHFLFSLAIFAALFSSCERDQQEPSSNDKPLLESFPRKQLLEHFTGETCGYCPYGMAMIEEAISSNKSNYVWISNHAGFADDEFTIAESKNIARQFGVTSAPSVMLNRQNWKYTDEDGVHSSKVFHPYYLTEFKSKTSNVTTASIAIDNNYDPETKQLKVTVSGQSIDPYALLSVTVAIKESGLHGPQADYYNTWEGWADFVHINVVRAYLTNYKGEPVAIQNNEYTLSFSYDWNDAWNAGNSSVVAFITDDETKEVLNAEEKPIVNGTEGGSNIMHEGITPVSVPDTYPEYDAVPDEAVNAVFSSGGYYLYGKTGNAKVVCVQLRSDNAITYNRQNAVPFAIIYFVLPNDAVGIPEGTYALNHDPSVCDAWAGTRNDEEFSINGSLFFLANTTYLKQGYLVGSEWLVNTGTISVSAEGISYDAVTLNGSTIKGTFAGTLENYDRQSAPRKVIIRK